MVKFGGVGCFGERGWCEATRGQFVCELMSILCSILGWRG